jgi:hypothetical protein
VTKSHVTMSRRQFFASLAAGMVVTAEGFWMPGERLISIPSRKIFVPAGRLAWVDAGVQCYFDGGKVIRIPEYFDLVVRGAQLSRDIDIEEQDFRV